MSPRADVSMTRGEIAALLDATRTATLATLGSDGWPHLSAMWFVPADDGVTMWTYAKSQKAQNLRRDPRCSFLVEAGEQYGALKGVLVRAEARTIVEVSEVESIGRALYERYTFTSTGIPYEEGPNDEVRRQAAKRIGIEIGFDRVASWDHAKLDISI